MKIGLFNKAEVLNSAGEFVGYNLGFDYATEHESGLEGLRNAFGITQQKKNAFMRVASRILDKKPTFGLAARTTKKIPDGISFVENEFFSIGYSVDFVNMDAYIKDTENKLAWPGRKEAFVGRWDDSGFLICTKVKEHYETLKTAFENKDIAFYLGAKGFLSSGGLHIVIASKIDKAVDDAMRVMDEDNHNLGKMADASGIEADVLNARKRFYALSPGWKNEEKTEVWFYLNPQDQKRYNSGWFTVEELREWIRDKGPVMNESFKEVKTSQQESPEFPDSFIF